MTRILELCWAAADELSVIRPNSVVSAGNNATANKLIRHLTRTCRQLSGRHDWQTLRREKVFTTSGDDAQSGAIPSDFLRFVKDTMFNRTRQLRVVGPLTPMEWQQYQATITTAVYDQFIQRGNAILFTGPRAAGETVAYEYITKNIGTTFDGDAVASDTATFITDDDTTFFDDELVISGIVWRYLKAEKQDYSEEYREHELRFADLTKMDGGRRKLDMGSAPSTGPSKPSIGGVAGGTNLEDLTTI